MGKNKETKSSTTTKTTKTTKEAIKRTTTLNSFSLHSHHLYCLLFIFSVIKRGLGIVYFPSDFDSWLSEKGFSAEISPT